MPGVLLTVAYDGTAFAGWQRQPGQRTVQGELERAILAIGGAQVKLRVAGRTDAGVHAHAQPAAFDCERSLPPIGWVRGLNGKLPTDIAVRAARECAPRYDPRFDAFGKTYRYLFQLGEARDPLLRDRAWHLGSRRSRPLRGPRVGGSDWLDLAEMDRAARLLVGEHDFAAFRSSADVRETTVRTIFSAGVQAGYGARDDLVAFEIHGTAFMHNMVRILAGTLVEIGRERMRTEQLQAMLLGAAARDEAGETAPACGLYLVDVTLGRSGAGAIGGGG